MMSRLGVLYALTDNELADLCRLPEAERYDYMLEEIEPRLLGTPRGCEMDKAWYGIQLCLGAGRWHETKRTPFNIICGGEYLVNTDAELMSLKKPEDVKKIVSYLKQHDLAELVTLNFPEVAKMVDELPASATDLEYLLEYCKDILPFYENALQENLQVIFTVDL